jgi:hypothetical protein
LTAFSREAELGSGEFRQSGYQAYKAPGASDGLRRLLEPNFEVVATAEDGEEMLRIARLQQPDLFVVDISMPNIGGIEGRLSASGKRIPRQGSFFSPCTWMPLSCSKDLLPARWVRTQSLRRNGPRPSAAARAAR